MPDLRYPYFTRNRILKIEMLENLRDYPRDAFDCLFEKLSDGIIQGLTPVVDKDTVTFSKGLLKHKGRLYVVRDLPVLSYGETDATVVVKITFNEEEQTPDYQTQAIEFLIDKRTALREDEIELGRFKLKKGAYLRTQYQDLYDFTTEYNTINIVHALYAGYGSPTLPNLVMKYFAQAALACNPKNPTDINFVLLCLNSERIERNVITYYLQERLGESAVPKRANNSELHDRLVKVLELVKKEGVPRKKPLNQRNQISLD